MAAQTNLPSRDVTLRSACPKLFEHSSRVLNGGINFIDDSVRHFKDELKQSLCTNENIVVKVEEVSSRITDNINAIHAQIIELNMAVSQPQSGLLSIMQHKLDSTKNVLKLIEELQLAQRAVAHLHHIMVYCEHVDLRLDEDIVCAVRPLASMIATMRYVKSLCGCDQVVINRVETRLDSTQAKIIKRIELLLYEYVCIDCNGICLQGDNTVNTILLNAVSLLPCNILNCVLESMALNLQNHIVEPLLLTHRSLHIDNFNLKICEDIECENNDLKAQNTVIQACASITLLVSFIANQMFMSFSYASLTQTLGAIWWPRVRHLLHDKLLYAALPRFVRQHNAFDSVMCSIDTLDVLVDKLRLHKLRATPSSHTHDDDDDDGNNINDDDGNNINDDDGNDDDDDVSHPPLPITSSTLTHKPQPITIASAKRLCTHTLIELRALLDDDDAALESVQRDVIEKHCWSSSWVWPSSSSSSLSQWLSNVSQSFDIRVAVSRRSRAFVQLLHTLITESFTLFTRNTTVDCASADLLIHSAVRLVQLFSAVAPIIAARAHSNIISVDERSDEHDDDKPHLHLVNLMLFSDALFVCHHLTHFARSFPRTQAFVHVIPRLISEGKNALQRERVYLVRQCDRTLHELGELAHLESKAEYNHIVLSLTHATRSWASFSRIASDVLGSTAVLSLLGMLSNRVMMSLTRWTMQRKDIPLECANRTYAVFDVIEHFNKNFLSPLCDDADMIAQFSETRQRFISLQDILHPDQSLFNLNKEMTSGKLSIFTHDELRNLIEALFEASQKRNAFLHSLHNHLQS